MTAAPSTSRIWLLLQVLWLNFLKDYAVERKCVVTFCKVSDVALCDLDRVIGISWYSCGWIRLLSKDCRGVYLQIKVLADLFAVTRS